MGVAAVVDIPGGHEQIYVQLTAKLFPQGKLPDGWLMRLVGPLWTTAPSVFERREGIVMNTKMMGRVPEYGGRIRRIS